MSRKHAGLSWGLAALVFAALPLAASEPLDEVLKKMDAAAAQFTGLSANISYTKVTVVVDDKSVESGGIFFQKEKGGKGYKVLLEFLQPEPKTILFKGGKAEIYRPRIAQVEEYDVGKDRELLEQFLLLGFGAGGTQLQKSYDVTLGGDATVGKTAVLRLELKPKGTLARNLTKVELWISKQTWEPVQQKFTEPSKDYLVVEYSNVQHGIQSDSRFEIKTQGKVKRVKPGRG